MKIVVVQPNIPTYRVDFYSRLVKTPGWEVNVVANKGTLGLLTDNEDQNSWANVSGRYRRFFGIEWQEDILGLSLKDLDLLVISGNPRNIPALILTVRARLYGVPCVWWGHFNSVSTKVWRARIRHFLYKIPKNICFYSDYELSTATKALKKYSLNLFSISNGLNIDDISVLRKEYIAKNRPFRILFIGRMVSRSRLDLVLEAMPVLAKGGVHLDVIGEGDMRKAYESWVAKNSLQDNVTFHGAITDENQLSPIFNNSSIFVSGDCVGLSIIHALAYGLPVIINANSKTQAPEADVLLLGEMGLTHSGDSASLGATVTLLLENYDLRDQFSRTALITLRNHHNTETMTKRFIDMVDSI